VWTLSTRFKFSLLLANVEVFLDQRALDAMVDGKAHPSQFPLFLQGIFSDCFHGSRPTHDKAVAATPDYLKQRAGKRRQSGNGISFRHPAEWTLSMPIDPRFNNWSYGDVPGRHQDCVRQLQTAFNPGPCGALNP
jgi:hypothetical protein